jgi:hypothetical protein
MRRTGFRRVRGTVFPAIRSMYGCMDGCTSDRTDGGTLMYIYITYTLQSGPYIWDEWYVL